KRVFARLPRGLSLQSARTQIGSLRPVPVPGSSHLKAEPERFKVVSLTDQLVGKAGRVLTLLLGACLIVQVMSCFNIGHMMLARRLRRAGDLGIQLALGSGTARLCWEALAESLILALAGTFVAVPVVLLSLPAAVAVISHAFDVQTHASLSAPVLI